MREDENDARIGRLFIEYYENSWSSSCVICPPEIEGLLAYRAATPLSLLQYCRHFGIDVLREPYLMWIARMAIALPLPEMWECCRNEEGDLHYRNVLTRATCSWHPGEPFVIRVVAFNRRYYRDNALMKRYNYVQQFIDFLGRPYQTNMKDFYNSVRTC